MSLTIEQVNEAINKGVAEALKPINTQLATLGEAVKPITTLQEQVKTLTETDSAATIAGKEPPVGKGKTDPTAAPAALTTESATALFKSMLDERDKAAQSTAQSTAAHEAWIKKNAPKLAGTKTAQRIFAGAATDEARKAALDEYVADLKSQGVKAPDLGATAAGEGGKTADADSAEAKKAAALEAAGKIKATQL